MKVQQFINYPLKGKNLSINDRNYGLFTFRVSSFMVCVFFHREQ